MPFLGTSIIFGRASLLVGWTDTSVVGTIMIIARTSLSVSWTAMIVGRTSLSVG